MEDKSRAEKPQQEFLFIEEKLVETGYIMLFFAADTKVLDSIWNTPGSAKALKHLALTQDANMLARFLAAEILFFKKENNFLETEKKELAPVYAAALSGNLTGLANTWGLPGVSNGVAGDNFEALGVAAIPHLIKILDDNTRMYYAGSQEATLGNSYKYRVRDLAAFFISRIRELPLNLEAKTGERDIRIDKMKGLLTK